jgi:hypothetical protein
MQIMHANAGHIDEGLFESRLRESRLRGLLLHGKKSFLAIPFQPGPTANYFKTDAQLLQAHAQLRGSDQLDVSGGPSVT